MTQYVWASDITDHANFGWYEPWYGFDVPEAERRARSGRVASRNRLAMPLENSDFPAETLATRGTPKGGRHLVICENRNVLVSEAMATVLSGFDLGDGALIRSQVVKRNKDRRSTRSLGFHLYYWKYGNWKKTLRPEHSNKVAPFENPAKGITLAHEIWTAERTKLEPDDLAFDKACLEGPDVWVERGLNLDLFLSDRLVKALKKEGLAGRLNLLRCRVVA